ncbi:protein CREG2 [Narcine bancroftii]|uniref:protein CREG2 n=1 Tax=Narcine bancroftii TaxID=1343680 RepID=UPI0038312DA9
MATKCKKDFGEHTSIKTVLQGEFLLILGSRRYLLEAGRARLDSPPDGGALKSSGAGREAALYRGAVYQQAGAMAALSPFALVLLAWLVHHCRGYVIVNSVSWAVTNQEETVSSEDEEEEEDGDGDVLPNRLFQSSRGGHIWKASYPAAVYRQQQDGMGESRAAARLQSPREVLGFPSRMFSYRRDALGVKGVEQTPPEPPRQGKARIARRLLHSSSWGFLATLSALDKIKSLPFGNIFLISDGSEGNSTGVPFFHISQADRTVADLMNNPIASLTLSEAEPNYCRQNLINPEDPRCNRLTLTGQMVTVPSDEIEFAKQAMFSRHPVMKKWPPGHNWVFMKMNIQQAWLQNWIGGVAMIQVEDYFKANPMSIK